MAMVALETQAFQLGDPYAFGASAGMTVMVTP